MYGWCQGKTPTFKSHRISKPNRVEIVEENMRHYNLQGNDANLGIKRARVWESLDSMIKLLEKASLASTEVEELKEKINLFTYQMVDAWGETHITHYMVDFTEFL